MGLSDRRRSGRPATTSTTSDVQTPQARRRSHHHVTRAGHRRPCAAAAGPWTLGEPDARSGSRRGTAARLRPRRSRGHLRVTARERPPRLGLARPALGLDWPTWPATWRWRATSSRGLAPRGSTTELRPPLRTLVRCPAWVPHAARCARRPASPPPEEIHLVVGATRSAATAGGEPPLRRRQRVLRDRPRPDADLLVRRFAEPRMDLGGCPSRQARADLPQARPARAPGRRLLDVGCGWGSMAMHAAPPRRASRRHHDQPPQAEWRARRGRRGPGRPLEIRLQDYRDIGGETVRRHLVGRHVRARRHGADARSTSRCSAPLVRRGGCSTTPSRASAGPKMRRPLVHPPLRVPRRRADRRRRRGAGHGAGRLRGPRRRVAAGALRPHPAPVGGQPRGRLGRGRRRWAPTGRGSGASTCRPGAVGFADGGIDVHQVLGVVPADDGMAGCPHPRRGVAPGACAGDHNARGDDLRARRRPTGCAVASRTTSRRTTATGGWPPWPRTTTLASRGTRTKRTAPAAYRSAPSPRSATGAAYGRLTNAPRRAGRPPVVGAGARRPAARQRGKAAPAARVVTDPRPRPRRRAHGSRCEHELTLYMEDNGWPHKPLDDYTAFGARSTRR